MENKCLFIGDSLTAGGQWDKLLGIKGVVNRGVDGDILDNMTFRLKKYFSELPTKVFIMIGINDLLSGKSLSTIKGEYDDLFSLCTNSENTQFYFQSILPVSHELANSKSISNQLINEVNLYIQSRCKEQDFQYINLAESFSDKDGKLKPEYTYDGLHLTKKGYQVWAEIIRNF